MLSADGFALGKDERWRSMRSNHIVGELGRSQSRFSFSCLRKSHSQAISCLRKSHSQAASWLDSRWSRAAAAQRSTATCCPHRKARLWTYLFIRERTHTCKLRKRTHTCKHRKRVQAPTSSLIYWTCKRKYIYKLYRSWAEDWTPSRSSPSTKKPGKKEENQYMEAELKCKLMLTFSFLIKSLPRRISWWQSFFLTNLGHSSSLWPNDPWPGRHQKQSHWKTQIIM